MRFGSLFSGIGGFDLGFEQAGMECAWQCEIDKTAQSVLARHWPGVPCIEDVRDVTRNNVATVDLICGGFPCQDLSVAGKRAGLAGERSGLWFEFRRIVEELRPEWVVVENVPGLLSSHRGADFAIVLQGLVELRYGVSWRVFDAQYFGVAQRRRRVFIVGSLGDGRSAEVLFEREGLFGHPPARREVGQGVAGTIAGVSNGGGANGPGRDVDSVDTLITFDWAAAASTDEIVDRPDATRGLSVSRTLAVFDGRGNDGGDVSYALAPGNTAGSSGVANNTSLIFEPRYARNGCGAPDTIAPPLKAQNGGTGKGDGAPVVAFVSENQRAEVKLTGYSRQLTTGGGKPGQGYPGALTQYGVRRLTPTECERLQGFPDGWTAKQSDSARYRQLGNAVAVPVARWIGERIAAMVVETAR